MYPVTRVYLYEQAELFIKDWSWGSELRRFHASRGFLTSLITEVDAFRDWRVARRVMLAFVITAA
jgi:hypothetical protein